MLTPLGGSLYAFEVPIPYPMKTVTLLLDVVRPVTLIDTGVNTSAAKDAIEAALSEAGLHWERIERVILTHHHPDHAGLAGLIEERSGAQVYALDREQAILERFRSDPEGWLQNGLAHFKRHGLPESALREMEAGLRASRSRLHLPVRLHSLTEGEQLTLAGDAWTVLWLPGHADGHLGLYSPARDLLIAGDAVLPRISPNIGLYARGRPDPLGDYLNTLERLRTLNPARAVVGHHGPLLDRVASRAAELSTHHAERLAFVRNTLNGTSLNAYQLSQAMFPRDLDTAGRRFALAEALAHAEHLHGRGELERQQGEVWTYGPSLKSGNVPAE